MRRSTIAAVSISCLLAVVGYGAPLVPVAAGAGVACAWIVWMERRRLRSDG
jgi:hypothetical protein